MDHATRHPLPSALAWIDHVTQTRQAEILGECLLRMVWAKAASSSDECLYHPYSSGENFGQLTSSQTARKKNLDYFSRRPPFDIQKSRPQRVRPNTWGHATTERLFQDDCTHTVWSSSCNHCPSMVGAPSYPAISVSPSRSASNNNRCRGTPRPDGSTLMMNWRRREN